jgi:hypothetical protein
VREGLMSGEILLSRVGRLLVEGCYCVGKAGCSFAQSRMIIFSPSYATFSLFTFIHAFGKLHEGVEEVRYFFHQLFLEKN